MRMRLKGEGEGDGEGEGEGEGVRGERCGWKVKAEAEGEDRP